MKVRILRNMKTKPDETPYLEGEEHDLPEAEAEALIKAGHAEAVVEAVIKSETPTRLHAVPPKPGFQTMDAPKDKPDDSSKKKGGL